MAMTNTTSHFHPWKLRKSPDGVPDASDLFCISKANSLITASITLLNCSASIHNSSLGFNRENLPFGGLTTL
jgi:hypothetical protein